VLRCPRAAKLVLAKPLVVVIIKAAGFRISELKTSYLSGARLMTYTYQGIAEIHP
jgi:hypothetical protein